jgi:hypothetical protein
MGHDITSVTRTSRLVLDEVSHRDTCVSLACADSALLRNYAYGQLHRDGWRTVICAGMQKFLKYWLSRTCFREFVEDNCFGKFFSVCHRWAIPSISIHLHSTMRYT